MGIVAYFVNRKYSVRALVLVMGLILAGCGKNNPYIGVWESEPFMGGMTEKLEFKSSSVASKGQEVSVTYKIENNRIGVVVKRDGNENIQWFNIVDQNTLEADNGMVKFVYHRK